MNAGSVLDRREQMISAAIETFARLGYHGAGVRDIAERAGVAAGTFYLYFPSKAACLLSLLDRLYEEVMGAIAARRASCSDLPAKLGASVEAVLHVFARRRDLARIALIQAPGADPQFDLRLGELHKTFAELVAQDLREAVEGGLIPPTDVEVVARAVVGSVHEVITAFLRDAQPDPEAAAGPLVRFVLQGVGLGSAGA